MKNISFQLTKAQILSRTKTVTRRIGWENVKVGDRLQACEKCMGLRPGQKLVKLCVIRVQSVRRESLSRLVANRQYGLVEVSLEGFPELSPEAFVEMFCRKMGCDPATFVTRLEFSYE